MPFVQLDSEPEFNKEILSSNRVFALNFTASWAPPCKQMNLVFKTLSETVDTINFVQIDVDDHPDLAEFYNVAAVPCFVFIQNKKVLETLTGADAQALSKAIENHSVINPNSIASKDANMKELDNSLHRKLNRLINSHPVMIFIKGVPQAPKCKFSRELVDILTKLDVGYGSFNILGDDSIREGLKEYSKWPTFPQGFLSINSVYVNGELVGGLDIVKELIESGEFVEMIPKDTLKARLTQLTGSFPVIVFIKGTRETPKCGFSKQIVQILQDQAIEFETFDILQDESVRQGLKEFSNWPTFPQLYVKGEFVGGLDVVKEMIEMGETLI